MMDDAPPPLRRTLLYVPGGQPAMIAEARNSRADVVCLDLEDTVAPDAKDEARAIVADAIAAGGFAALELIVRINLSDPQERARDLAMLRAIGWRGLALPKVSGPDDLAPVREALGPGPLRLWAMIETARGLLRAPEIAMAEDVTALIVGSADLAADLRLPPADAVAGLHLYGASVVAAARAAGRSAIEGTAGVEAPNPCGFDGRSTYPGQDVAAINARFSPSPDEVTRAQAALDRPYVYGDHLVAARRTLRLAERVAARARSLADGGR